MKYIKVRWLHDFDTDPIELYSETDKNNMELRKIEIYKDLSFGMASFFL